MILDEAKEIIYGDREQTYGDPGRNFRDIAGHWSIILKKEISVDQVLLCMIAVKLTRLSFNPSHHDSQVDVCGYASLLERVQEILKEQEKKP